MPCKSITLTTLLYEENWGLNSSPIVITYNYQIKKKKKVHKILQNKQLITKISINILWSADQISYKCSKSWSETTQSTLSVSLK